MKEESECARLQKKLPCSPITSSLALLSGYQYSRYIVYINIGYQYDPEWNFLYSYILSCLHHFVLPLVIFYLLTHSHLDFSQSAVGHEYVAEVEKHSSQTDAARGFGGKYGVEKDRADKVSDNALSLRHPTQIMWDLPTIP